MSCGTNFTRVKNNARLSLAYFYSLKAIRLTAQSSLPKGSHQNLLTASFGNRVILRAHAQVVPKRRISLLIGKFLSAKSVHF